MEQYVHAVSNGLIVEEVDELEESKSAFTLRKPNQILKPSSGESLASLAQCPWIDWAGEEKFESRIKRMENYIYEQKGKF